MENFPIHTLWKDHRSFWETPGPELKRLWIQGRPEALSLLDQLPDRGLGVVGTRNPTPATQTRTREWIQSLRGQNLVVISGFARGVDTVAHQAALQANLPTIAILGAGLDVDYPKSNQSLRRQILEQNGLLVSEFETQTQPYASNFHHRNRIIAAFSQTLWVMEAARRSGALNTAKWTRMKERKIWAVPCAPNDPAFAGNQRLLEEPETWNSSPLWGPQTLGEIWMEIQNESTLQPDCQALRRYMTQHEGPFEVGELLAWAIGQNWNPRRFYEVIQELVENEKIEEFDGKIKLSKSNRD